MEDFEKKVIDWIDRNFDTTQITLEDIPQGKIVKLVNGEKVVVYWDFIQNCIVTRDE